MTLAEFAEPVGIKGNTLSDVELGKKKMSSAAHQLMILYYSLNENFLEHGEQPMFLEVKGRPPSGRVGDAHKIPVLGKVPAGIPNLINGEVLDYIELPDAPPGCYCLLVHGESMEPLIRAGDYVLFVIDQAIQNGDIVIVNDEWGESMVKRYREKADRQYLASDNPNYPTYEANENYRIVGKVVKAWRELKI